MDYLEDDPYEKVLKKKKKRKDVGKKTEPLPFGAEHESTDG